MKVINSFVNREVLNVFKPVQFQAFKTAKALAYNPSV